MLESQLGLSQVAVADIPTLAMMDHHVCDDAGSDDDGVWSRFLMTNHLDHNIFFTNTTWPDSSTLTDIALWQIKQKFHFWTAPRLAGV